MKKLNAIVFIVFIFGFFLISIFSVDKDYSDRERRKLEQFTSPTIQTLTNGKWFQSFIKYSADQFPLREDMREINAKVRKNLFLQNDIGGIYVENGYIFKSDYPTKPDKVIKFSEKLNQVYYDNIKEKAENYYVSVIPDKGHFDSGTHLKSDANEIAQTFVQNLDDAIYIDIFDNLSIESYYKTDTHWTQNEIFGVMGQLASEIGFDAPVKSDYKENILEDFYGVYHGQSALNLPTDDLIYMTSEVTDSAKLFNFETNSYEDVYNLEKFYSKDGYNLFSSGASPLVTIESPMARTDKEIVIIRDSFGSSIAPLFLEEYSKVTLLDLRYMSSSLVPNFVNFQNKDVLILLSSLILNGEMILK